MTFRPRIGPRVQGIVDATAAEFGMSKQAAVQFLISVGRSSVERGITVEEMRDALAQLGSGSSHPGSNQEPVRCQPGTRKIGNDNESSGTGIEISAAAASAFAAAGGPVDSAAVGNRFLKAFAAGHSDCCLDAWEQANCPSIARKAVRVGLRPQQLAKLEEALAKANACELAKRTPAASSASKTKLEAEARWLGIDYVLMGTDDLAVAVAREKARREKETQRAEQRQRETGKREEYEPHPWEAAALKGMAGETGEEGA